MSIKRNKSRTFIYTLCGLTILSLGTVGFSSWIINSTQGDSENFNISFGEISDNTIQAFITSSDTTIRFDALESSYCTNEITNGDGQLEDLNYSVTFTLTSASTSLVNMKLNFEYDDNAALFTSTLGRNPQYINCSVLNDFSYTMPSGNQNEATVSENSGVKLNVDYTNEALTEATVTVNFSFSWGNAFGNVNPCTSKVENVIEVLNNFKTAYQKITNNVINLTITPSRE